MTLKDLFVSYKALPTQKESITEPISKFSRLDRLRSIISSTQKENKEEVKEENKEETQQEEVPKQKTQQQTPSTRYTRMTSYIDNKNPVRTVMNFFINKGLTPEQASGFAGNFLSESDLNPAAINQAEKRKGYKGYGRGIAQWSNERVQQFRDYIGKNVEDASLDEQLNFVWHELEQRPELMRQLSSAKTAEEAADLIYRGYENGGTSALATPQQLTEIYGRAWSKLGYRPYDYSKEVSVRQKKALQVLNKYQS